MTDEAQVLADSHSAEAINAAKNAAEAVEKARQSQFEAAVLSQREETKQVFIHAMREVLSTGEEGTKVLLLQKIPLLCTDMLVMKGDIQVIKQVGKYILLGIGSLFLTLLGALLLRAV